MISVKKSVSARRPARKIRKGEKRVKEHSFLELNIRVAFFPSFSVLKI